MIRVRSALEPPNDRRRVDRRRRLPDRLLAGDREHGRGRALAQAEARAPEPRDLAVPRGLAGRPERPLEVGAELLGAREPARDVVADMGDGRRPRLRREHGVERRDAVGLGGRHGEPPADVVQARLGDLADPVLERVKRREEQVAAAPGVVPASRDVALGRARRASRPPSPRSPARGPHRPPRARPGDASGPMTWRSIAAECTAGAGAWPGRRPASSDANGRRHQERKLAIDVTTLQGRRADAWC